MDIEDLIVDEIYEVGIGGKIGGSFDAIFTVQFKGKLDNNSDTYLLFSNVIKEFDSGNIYHHCTPDSDGNLIIEERYVLGENWAFESPLTGYEFETVQQTWKKYGRCIECGNEGAWVRMALICPHHGIIGGI